MTHNDQPLADAVDAVLRDAVQIIRAEMFVTYCVEWARVGGRVVPWEHLREQADEHGIHPDHLAAALENLHAGTRHVGDWDVVHLPAKEPA
jgi:hypothetical protein